MGCKPDLDRNGFTSRVGKLVAMDPFRNILKVKQLRMIDNTTILKKNTGTKSYTLCPFIYRLSKSMEQK